MMTQKLQYKEVDVTTAELIYKMMKRHLDKWITNHPQYNYEAELRNGMEIHITLQREEAIDTK
jgi:hypothetical protein